MSIWSRAAIATEWRLQSPSSDGLSVQTPLAHIGIEAGAIRLPIQRWHDGVLVEQIILKGYGIGIGVGAGLDLGPVNFSDSPKNLSGTKTSTPGVGTTVFRTPDAPDPMQARDFEGILVAGTVSHTDVSAQASGVGFLFCNPSTMFRIERSVLQAVSPIASILITPPIRAFGFAAGLGLQTAIVSVGASYIKYTVKLE